MRKTESLNLVLWTSVLLIAGCKEDAKPSKAAPPAAPVVVPVVVPVEFPLAKGESYYGGSATETNVVEWKLEDGTIVYLAIVKTGATTDGRDDAVLRAFRPGSDTIDVGPKYSLDPKVDHWSELKVVSKDRVMFRYGEAGESRRARNGVLLRWDAEAGRVRIAKRWTGGHAEQEPAWLKTGTYEAPPESQALCLQVIARIVSCEKDPEFRDAMFRRDDPAEKVAMQKHFDSHVADWKDPAGAKLQCQKWATDEYVDTNFSDVAALKRLAAESEHDCRFFAAEVVDEGGLPTALVDENG